MLDNLKGVLVDRDGATLVEYSLVVALIAIASIAVVTLAGKNISAAFMSYAKAVGAA